VRVNLGARLGNAADAAAKTKMEPAPCNSDVDRDKQVQVTLLRLEWLARADAIYRVSEREPFSKDMTALGPTQALRQLEYDRMREAFIKHAGDDAWAPLIKGIALDARNVLLLSCGDRVLFQTQQPRKCPAVPAQARKYTALAIGQLKSVETFASAYEA